jgi:peptidoglycan-associated lipoprotein
MKKLLFLSTIASIFFLTGCSQRSDVSSWEGMKTAGRYMARGVDSLFGKDYDSYMVSNDGELLGPNDGDDFIPLNDKDLKSGLDKAYPQPKTSPGEGTIPNLNRFSSPNGQLASIFQPLHFDTDDHILREHNDLINVQKMAAYLKKHPKTLVCIEGHCDERASAAYNMALGTRRANHLRVLLIKQGIDFNRIYTISYGKEQPLATGHLQQDWEMNRRVQFKLFEK